MKQENKEKIAQAEEILERLKEQRGGNVLSIHKKMANDPKLLQAFSQQFAICKQVMRNLESQTCVRTIQLFLESNLKLFQKVING